MSLVSTIRFATFPSTKPPPAIAFEAVGAFREQEAMIASVGRETGMKSNEVLAAVAPRRVKIGFDVELGKQNEQRLARPVFFGENGQPTMQYSIDAFHAPTGCGLEVEAGRAWMSNAVYRDLVQALVMVERAPPRAGCVERVPLPVRREDRRQPGLPTDRRGCARSSGTHGSRCPTG